MRFILFITIFFSTTLCFGQSRRMTTEDYISRYENMVKEAMKQYGIPASIKMAQAILESDSGNSRLATEGNNHFGIKCKSNWKGKSISHDDDAKGECFRKYSSAEESFRDHSEFLSSSQRYASLFKLSPKNYKGWAYGLKKAGYATNPKYPELLISLIERYNLTSLDNISTSGKRHKETITTSVKPTVTEEVVTVSAGNGKSSSRKVYITNGIRYILTAGADSFTSLAKATGIKIKRLLKYNDYPYAVNLDLGTRIYLDSKKLSSSEHSTHTVEQGETLHSISQFYGVTEKSLRQRNNIRKDREPRVGQKIRLR